MNRLLLLCALVFSFHAQAQVPVPPKEKMPFYMSPARGVSLNNPNDRERHSFARAIVYTSSSDAVFSAMVPGGGEGLVRMNVNGRMFWSVPLEMEIINICKVPAGILVVGMPLGSKDDEPVKEVNAVLVNAGSGKVLARTNLYRNEGNVYMDVRMLVDAKDNFHGILMRESSKTKSKGSYASTKRMEVLQLDDALNISKRINYVLPGEDAAFSRMVVDNNGALCLLSYFGDVLAATRYNLDGTIAVKMSHLMETGGKSYFTPLDAIAFDEDNSNVLYGGLYQEGINVFFKMDFAAQKLTTRTQKLNKEFAKTVEVTDVPWSNKMALHKRVDWAKPYAVFQHAGKVIFLQMTYRGGDTYPYLLTSFDKELQPQKTIALNNTIEVFSLPLALTPGLKQDGGKLKMTFTSLAAFSGYCATSAVIDLEKLAVDKLEKIGTSNVNSAIEGGSTLFFDKGFVLSYFNAKVKLRSYEMSTSIVPVAY
ncbi:MAG: hypothetical protein EOP50_07465 [Sphingobacteriales bacterium]|nr:MAG: hypothetical protein EOP50_07465 [Sphingobacteriales bacterium]